MCIRDRYMGQKEQIHPKPQIGHILLKMPGRHRAGNFKQKNKPFKGAKRNKKATTSIKKLMSKSKGIKKLNQSFVSRGSTGKRNLSFRALKRMTNTRRDNSTNYISIQENKLLDVTTKQVLEKLYKKAQAPKIVLIASFNEAANVEDFKNKLVHLIRKEYQSPNYHDKFPDKPVHKFAHDVVSISGKSVGGLVADNLMFVTCPRDTTSFLDYCKVADILVVALSCKNTVTSGMTLDPYENARAFDDFGYNMISNLRAQGLLPVVGVLQDLDLHPQPKHTKIRKLFHRFFASEFSDEDKFIPIGNDQDSYFKFLRAVQSVNISDNLSWRAKRGYLLAEKLEVDTSANQLEITGYLKGTSISANQIIHITGYGDFQMSRIDILKSDAYKPIHETDALNKKSGEIEMGDERTQVIEKIGVGEIIMSQFPLNDLQESLQKMYVKGLDKEGNKIVERNLHDDNGGLEIEMGNNDNQPLEPETGMGDEKMIQMDKNMEAEGDDEIGDEGSDIAYDEESALLDLNNMGEEKRKLKFTMVPRSEEDLEFTDEVDYGAEEILREKYKNYKGLKSFRTSDWDPYEDVPEEYEKIFIFDDFSKTMKNALINAKEDAFAYQGFYIKIYVKNFPLHLLPAHSMQRPFIVSTLFRHEQKLSVLHTKVLRSAHYQEEIRSKEEVEMHLGFRILKTRPIYSKMFQNCNKTKYEKKLLHGGAYMASVYAPVIYPPCTVLILKARQMLDGSVSKQLIATGEVLKSDPLRVILKRIILTGYPFKIHKRKAVCRLMFFNTEDINYYRPVELWTKKGMRGHIIESVGTHGYMKCTFNNLIKPNDTICMNLYKRIFPKWNKEFDESIFQRVLRRIINLLSS
eukprot:TRINITY_DN754_c0_g2_i3.p1 TRINITY_DN754_c0_g2~~TRINITY_DN754_c0_g2_i3.p1  ORF type:complete len:859 (-),score=228.30 TRINITY_DN754_c0_g2_i3:1607-4183(-)